MHRKADKIKVLLIFLCLFLFFSVVWRHSSNASSQIVPPVQQIKVFSLSNAPSINNGVAWSTNVPQAISQFVAQMSKTTNRSAFPFSPAKATYAQFKNSKQQDAFNRLEKNTLGSAQLFLRPDNSTPIQIKGYPLMKAVGGGGTIAEQNENTARAFLRENASLLLLNDPDKELRILASETDSLGMFNIRYAQTYAGLDVWPAQLSIHLDARGNVCHRQ